MSGKNVYIAAGDTVDIVGNKEVNIGGTTINMASASVVGEGYTGVYGNGGIHLVSTVYNYDDSDESLTESSTSYVNVHGDGIELASKNGIIIKSGAGIDIKSSDNTAVSAIQIDKDKGIFIGSSNKLKFYTGTAAEYFYGPYHGAKFHKGDYWEKMAPISGQSNLNAVKEQLSQAENYYYINRTANQTGVTHYIANKDWDQVYNSLSDAQSSLAIASIDGWEETSAAPPIVGASVELSPEHLLLGMSSSRDQTSGATAIEMFPDQVIIAAGSTLNTIATTSDTNTFINGNLSGLLIRKDYIGMAVGSSNNRSILSMKPSEVRIGQMSLLSGKAGNEPEDYYGSFIWLSDGEIYIGSVNNSGSYTNTGNFTLNTNNIKIQTKLMKAPENGGTEIRATASENLPVSKMGFVLGKDLNTNSPEPALGFWMDQNNATHLVVNGDIKARSFTLDTTTAVSDFNSAVNNSATIATVNSNVLAGTETSEKVYYLSRSDNAPNKPSTKVTTLTTDNINTWALTYPTWPSNWPAWAPNTAYAVGDRISYRSEGYSCKKAHTSSDKFSTTNWNSGPYYYYTCLQVIAKNGTVSFPHDPVCDKGVTSASATAMSAANTRDTFTANGLLANYKWGTITYPVALTSTGTMLIGANSGITIAKSADDSSAGSALVIDKSGIAMYGSAISLDATSALSLTATARDSNNTQTSYFRINTQYLSSTSTYSPFIIYSGSSWSAASFGMRFRLKGTNDDPFVGLEVKGDITATSFTLGSGVKIPYSSISGTPTIPNPSDFTIDGLSAGYRAVSTNAPKYQNGNNTDIIAGSISDFSAIPVYLSGGNYNANTFVRRSQNEYSVYYLPNGYTENTGWGNISKTLAYRRTVDLTSTGALILGANTGLYVIKDNNSTLSDTYLAIDKNKINLDYDDSNYIHMNKDGIRMYSANIKINGKPIWFNDRIKFGTSKPAAPDLSDYPADDRAWIWIQPNQFSQWTYTQSSGQSASSTNDLATITLNNSIQQPITDANGTSYTYEVSFKLTPNNQQNKNWYIRIQLQSSDGNRTITFSPSTAFAPSLSGNTFSFSTQITAANNSANTKSSNVCSANTVNLLVGLYSPSNGQMGSDAGYGSSGFTITQASLTAGTNSANNGTFPCTVYYIKE